MFSLTLKYILGYILKNNFNLNLFVEYTHLKIYFDSAFGYFEDKGLIGNCADCIYQPLYINLEVLHILCYTSNL